MFTYRKMGCFETVLAKNFGILQDIFANILKILSLELTYNYNNLNILDLFYNKPF